jgi:3,4-dihydroxyphenylacetate 2,3-dioxygenase
MGEIAGVSLTSNRIRSEGDFDHPLMMLGAVGGPDRTAPGELFSDYENATGTGQVHVWFEKPEAGWTA